MSDHDIRIDAVNAPFPDEGRFGHFIISRKIDVPALIAAGTLGATGLVSGDSYFIFNLPKYSITLAGFIFVRTVDAGTGTVTIEDSASVTWGTTLAVSGLGVIMSGSGAGFNYALVHANNTGAGTDYVYITIGTHYISTAIFDVCLVTIKGAQPYNAGSLAGSTGQ